jgi:hypothetical protein
MCVQLMVGRALAIASLSHVLEQMVDPAAQLPCVNV